MIARKHHSARGELRARMACEELRHLGIDAAPVYDPTTGRYTGRISVDAEVILAAFDPIRASRAGWAGRSEDNHLIGAG